MQKPPPSSNPNLTDFKITRFSSRETIPPFFLEAYLWTVCPQTLNLGALFWGNLKSSELTSLKQNNIKHVVRLLPDPATYPKDEDISVYHIPIEDAYWKANVFLAELSDCLAFIHSHRMAGNNVLIHCFAGVSRSTSLAIAYMLKYVEGLNDSSIPLENRITQCVTQLRQEKKCLPNVPYGVEPVFLDAIKNWMEQGCPAIQSLEDKKNEGPEEKRRNALTPDLTEEDEKKLGIKRVQSLEFD